MSSELKVNSIRDTSNNEAITISSGNVSFNNTISAGTIGDNVVFPTNHIIQKVFNPTIGNTSTAQKTSLAGVADAIGQITITSGNGVLIYLQAFAVAAYGSSNAIGSVNICRGTVASLGTVLSKTYFGDAGGGAAYGPISFWAYDSSPSDATTPDYAIAVSRESGGTQGVNIGNFASPDFQFYLFEVQA